jgi:hypothetical protein
MGKNRLFQESFQKNPPEVTPILYMESNRHYVEKLLKEGNNRNMFSEIIMDMGKYFPCKWGKIDFFKKASRKIHQRSHRVYIWNRIINMWKIFVQKERNDRNMFSEIFDIGIYWILVGIC